VFPSCDGRDSPYDDPEPYGRDLTTANEGSGVPSSIRPGDVLADRYRLVDLLTESGGGRFWRAHDRILERHVALHVIAEDDERAAALMEAARRSATVHDRRLLRVLDADETDGLCFVVNEWGSGDSLDIMLAGDGALGPRRAAWIVSEVAAAIAVGHRAGVAHGRLVPENILIDHTGGVRLIGFAVDAALHGLPPGRLTTDVTDLGSLLYAALTGRWSGSPGSAVPPAPVEQGRVLRPRQVRAGIPRPLDALCDEVLNPYAGPAAARLRGVHDLATAQGIADYLCEFVGDPTGLAEAEAAAGHRDTTEIAVLPPVPDLLPHDAVEQAPEPAPEPEPTPEPEPDPAPEVPTQAGLPIFDDDGDVSWMNAPGTPAPPPPPFEEPPERPLFAPAPTDGAPERTPRPGRAPTPAPEPGPRPTPPGPSGRSFWPWDTGTGPIAVADPDAEPQEVPGRSWLRLAAIVGAAVLLLLAVVVAYNIGRGRTPLGAVPEEESPTPTPTSQAPITPAADPVDVAAASDFDPQGSPREENPEEVPLAIDGDAATAWRTQTYEQNFGPQGLKTGVGLLLDLGSSRPVSAVDVTVDGGSTGVSVYVTDTAPTGVRGLTPVQSATIDAAGQVALPEPVTGRYVTVWLTSLPAVPGGFQGAVAEVTVRG
jgi:protein kinase-like protein